MLQKLQIQLLPQLVLYSKGGGAVLKKGVGGAVFIYFYGKDLGVYQNDQRPRDSKHKTWVTSVHIISNCSTVKYEEEKVNIPSWSSDQSKSAEESGCFFLMTHKLKNTLRLFIYNCLTMTCDVT